MGVMIPYPSALAWARFAAYFIVASRACAICATTSGARVASPEEAAGAATSGVMSTAVKSSQMSRRIAYPSLPGSPDVGVGVDLSYFRDGVAGDLRQPGCLTHRLRARGIVLAEELAAVDGEVAVDPAHAPPLAVPRHH